MSNLYIANKSSDLCKQFIPTFSLVQRNIKIRICFFLTVCYHHITYEIQNDSTLFSLPECQGTPCSKEKLARSFYHLRSFLVTISEFFLIKLCKRLFLIHLTYI